MAKQEFSKGEKPKHLQPFTTVAELKARKAIGKAYEFPYAPDKSLRVRVQPGGTKAFIWRFRHGDKQRFIQIGTYPDMSIAKAHKELEDLREKRDEGLLFDDENLDNPKTVKDLAEVWFREYALKKRKNPDQARYVLNKDILPVIGHMKLNKVKPAHVTKLIRGVVNRPAPVWAGKVLGITKQLFKYGEQLGYLDRSPAYSHTPNVLGVENNQRERHLTAEEIPLLWDGIETAPRMSDPVRTAFKVLLLSGVRSSELTKAKWEHIDWEKGTWFIPVENSKTRAWTVPLSTHLAKLFEALKDYAGDSVWVVPGRVAGNPVTDKVLGRALRRLFDSGHLNIEPCTPHDFRRTMRTHMAEMDIESHIAEKCLNHSLGRIEETYNVNKLIEPRREALEKWGRFVTKLIDPRREFIRVVK